MKRICFALGVVSVNFVVSVSLMFLTKGCDTMLISILVYVNYYQVWFCIKMWMKSLTKAMFQFNLKKFDSFDERTRPQENEISLCKNKLFLIGWTRHPSCPRDLFWHYKHIKTSWLFLERSNTLIVWFCGGCSSILEEVYQLFGSVVVQWF